MVGLGSTTHPINGLSLDDSKIEVGQTMAFCNTCNVRISACI